MLTFRLARAARVAVVACALGGALFVAGCGKEAPAPTTMAELSQALQQLGPDDAKRVQVLFVTVDPERDTPALMAQYVPAFNPTFVGLRPANDAELVKVTKDFRVYYAKVPGKTPDSYTMDHTAASYVFDPDGKLRLFARDGQGAAPWVHDIKLLLS